jgi:hypothetical protein
MLRNRTTVPARALAILADLDAMEAAVLEAENAAASGLSENTVFLPEGQKFDSPLCRAIADALPDNTTYGFNSDADHRVWISVITAEGAADPAPTPKIKLTCVSRHRFPGSLTHSNFRPRRIVSARICY